MENVVLTALLCNLTGSTNGHSTNESLSLYTFWEVLKDLGYGKHMNIWREDKWELILKCIP